MPTPLKRYVRRMVLEPAKRRIDDWTLGRAIKILRGSGVGRSGGVGVDAASLGQRGLLGRSQLFRQDSRTRAELQGTRSRVRSGLTTIVAGLLAEACGVTSYSLELDSAWAEVVERALTNHRIPQVQVKYAPLQQYDGFVWYDQTCAARFPQMV
jgi:hypothetical protein